MKLSILYFVLGLGFSLVGSQKEVKIFSIDTSVERLTRGCLVYCDQEYIEFCNKNGIKCFLNEPFIPVTYYPYQFKRYGLLSTDEQLRAMQNCGIDIDQIKSKKNNVKTPDTTTMTNEFRKITHVPFSLLHDGEKFKQMGNVLFEFKRSIENLTYNLQATLDSDFGEEKPENIFNQFSFKDEPNYMVGGQFQDGALVVYVDTENLKKTLIKAEILAEIDGKIVHGPKGYFGPEAYHAKLREYRKKLFFSYTKKPFLGFSFLFSCYLLWTIYSKYS